MDRDKWLKSMSQFSTVCGVSTINNQIILFDEHDCHIDERKISYIYNQNIQPFVLKAGDYVKNHTNDNGLNEKLKSHYNDAKLS